MSLDSINKSKNELLREARSQELEGNTNDAIKGYNLVISKDPLNAAAYNRLMILYRRLKDYRNEKAIIKQAIGAYEKEIRDDQRSWKKAHNKSARISLSLAQSMGLLTDKGFPVYEEPQIITWRKRLDIVQKKIKAPAKSQKKGAKAEK